MTCEQESKLPVYARLYLEHLRNRIVGLEGRLTEQRRVHAYNGGHDGRLYELDLLRNDMRPLAEGRVRIVLDQEGAFLDVTSVSDNKSGTYRASIQAVNRGAGVLDIRPEASNVVTIGVEPW